MEEVVLRQYLRSTEVIDWEHPSVVAQAHELGESAGGVVDIARRCFVWVRDEIQHTVDFGLSPVTCSASQVLRDGSGFCYAKSHLLAALLRANDIAAGLCYQRLREDDESGRFCLHGLNAMLLPDIGWYRVDARGNREGVNAQFVPPTEQLAFAIRLPGERDVAEVYADPLPEVVEALRAYERADELASELPDLRSRIA